MLSIDRHFFASLSETRHPRSSQAEHAHGGHPQTTRPFEARERPVTKGRNMFQIHVLLVQGMNILFLPLGVLSARLTGYRAI